MKFEIETPEFGPVCAIRWETIAASSPYIQNTIPSIAQAIKQLRGPED